eukprot:scaffold13.g222.t1
MFNRLGEMKQLVLVKGDVLQAGTPEQQRGAAQALGELGDPDALPLLAQGLASSDPRLVEVCEEAMWALFMRAPTPETAALMDSGCRAMQHPAQWGPALQCFTDVVRQAPSFAEGYNKRATVLYLLHRYDDAIEDCRMVLDLNPYHFGAASGLGMCLARAGRPREAIAAYQAALAIHPNLASLRVQVEAMQEMLREKQE